MADAQPWEKYQQPAADGPWAKYAAPPPEQPGVVSRFYEKTPIAPIVSQMSANLPSPAEGGGAMATQLVKNAGSLIANMAKGQWNAMSADFKAASDSADRGDHLQAINHFLRAARRIYDPITTQAQDTVESLATDLSKGNVAGAAGTLSPALLGLAGEAVPAIARAAPEAGAIAKDAVVGGYKGGIALTPSVGGVRLPASAAGLVGGGVADIGAAHLGLPPAVLPAVGFAAPIVKGAVANVRAGLAARAATEAAEAAKASTSARVPVWQGPPAEAAPAPVADMAAPITPEMAQEIFNRNRAARNAATDARDPQGAPQVIARLKALGNEPQPAPAAPPATAPGTITIKQLASDPETFNRIARASMINDNLTAMAKQMGYSAEDLQLLKEQNPTAFDDIITRISKTPLGTKNSTWWRPSTNAASGKTRAMVQERVSPTEPRVPAEAEDLSGLFQQSLDALETKGKALLKDTRGSLTLGDVENPRPSETVYRATSKGQAPTAFNRDGILYTTPDKNYAGNFGAKTSRLQASPQHTLDLRSLSHDNVTASRFVRELERHGVEISDQLRDRLADVEETVGGEPLAYFGNHGKALREAIQKAGFDSARINEYVEQAGKKADSLMLFDPKHIKVIDH